MTMDLGEKVGVEIKYPDLWKMKAKYPFSEQRLGIHTRYVFSDCIVVESVGRNGTILMKFETGNGEK